MRSRNKGLKNALFGKQEDFVVKIELFEKFCPGTFGIFENFGLILFVKNDKNFLRRRFSKKISEKIYTLLQNSKLFSKNHKTCHVFEKGPNSPTPILGGSGRESPGGMKNLEATESGFENFQKKGVKKRFFFGFFKSEKIADLVETF